MATINFYYRGKTEEGNLTVKLKHSTTIDYRISSKIVSKRVWWFNTKNKHRKLAELSLAGGDAKNHKTYLEKIQDKLLLNFRTDFNKGIPISKEWFIKNIDMVAPILLNKNDIENAQSQINEQEIKLLNEEKDIYDKNLVVSAVQRVMDVEYFNNKTRVKVFNQLMNKIKVYNSKNKVELKTKEVTQNFIDEFTAFLMIDLKHQISTARKHCKSLVHAVKYQKNAFPEQVELSSGIRDINYKRESKAERRKTRSEIVITLSFDELNQIHNTDVPERLLNAKRVLLIGCEVGLRVSDYDKLIKENIKTEGTAKYWNFWNQKTGSYTSIPITQRIKKFIDLYGMPKTYYIKTADVIINREIKEVCALAGINDMIQGRKSMGLVVNGEKIRRSVSNKYPKHELITTHSLRRSFATNYTNILTPFQIRQLTGHASDAQLNEYLNQDINRSEIVKQMLDKMNTNEELNRTKEIQLKVIKN